MTMDDLANSWNRLTLSDREGPGCNLTHDDSVMVFSIAAKFLTRRALNVEVIAKTFTPLWRTRNSRSKILTTIKFYSLLITRRMWIEFLTVNHGVPTKT